MFSREMENVGIPQIARRQSLRHTWTERWSYKCIQKYFCVNTFFRMYNPSNEVMKYINTSLVLQVAELQKVKMHNSQLLSIAGTR